eukprot:symbB.v1.2.004420.t1/scaffold237.1/size257402/10
MMEAFQGQCLAPTYDEAGADLADAMARLHVPEVKFYFIPKVLPLIQDGRLLQRLTTEDLLCADVGCSGADCTMEMARHFPNATFHAYEVADPALDRAKSNVEERGLTNLTVVDAKIHPLGKAITSGQVKKRYDMVMCYDVLHDLSHPEDLIEEVREVLAPDGVWVIVDIASNGEMADNLRNHQKAATYYGISVCVCLPSGLSADGGRGLGTLGFPPHIAEPMFRSHGFSQIRSFKMPTLEKNQVYEVAETPNGVALLMEQRVFVLLAYCPLLRHFVLNTESAYVCFMPNQGCKEGMEILGAWCFIVGAACYMLGDFIELMKTCALIFLRLKQEEAARQIERAMLCYLFRRRLASVGRLRRSRSMVLPSKPSRGRRESLKEVGLVRAFTEALGQKPIIRALQLKDIPKLGCSPKAADRRKELLAQSVRPMVPPAHICTRSSEAHGNYIYSQKHEAQIRGAQASELWRGFQKNDSTEFNEARVHMGHIMRK